MKTKYLSLLIIALFLSACSTTHKADTSSQTTNNNIAVNNDASFYAELDFPKGSANLDAADRSALQDLISKSMNRGEVDQIKVLTWADQEYPVDKEIKLSSQQKKIADLRNDKIKNFLKKTYPTLDVSVYNMASRPNVLQDLFNTSDARIKTAYEEANTSTSSDKASKSLILSIVKSKQ